MLLKPTFVRIRYDAILILPTVYRRILVARTCSLANLCRLLLLSMSGTSCSSQAETAIAEKVDPSHILGNIEALRGARWTGSLLV